MEQPIKSYVPSIAPSSLAFYGKGPIKSLKDSFLVGALVKRHLNVVSLDGKNEKRYYVKMDERFRFVKTLKDGKVLFSTDSGDIFLIKSTDIK